MFKFIVAKDPTVEFLNGILFFLNSKNVPYDLIYIDPNEASYTFCLDYIRGLDKYSDIVFMGHGQGNQLYGGENLIDFPKRAFVQFNEMAIFKEQNLFLLACNSADLIKRSFKLSGIKKTIGFGALPTSLDEIINDRKLAPRNFSEITIQLFKECIVNVVSRSLHQYYLKDKSDFFFLKDHLLLLISIEINKAILEIKDINLALLLFNMKMDLILY